MQSHKYFYERNLPHYQPEEATYFITYRLHGSIPKSEIESLKQEYQLLKKNKSEMNDEQIWLMHAGYFKQFDSVLDGNLNQPYWLKEEAIMTIISNSIYFYAGKQYDLWCFSIMPNHVHILLTLLPGSIPLYAILQRHKRFTARQANKILCRSGVSGIKKVMIIL